MRSELGLHMLEVSGGVSDLLSFPLTRPGKEATAVSHGTKIRPIRDRYLPMCLPDSMHEADENPARLASHSVSRKLAAVQVRGILGRAESSAR